MSTNCCPAGLEMIRFEIVEACCAECWAHVTILSRPPGASSVDGEGDDHVECGPGSTFTANPSTDVLTAAGHGLVDTTPVRFRSTGTLPAGLSEDTTYFVRDATTDTFKVSATSGGAAVDVTDAGTGTHTVHRVLAVDPGELIVYDPADYFLNEPNADLVDRVGYAVRLERDGSATDPCSFVPSPRWEILSLCCPEDACP
jgi:hypothetical protein